MLSRQTDGRAEAAASAEAGLESLASSALAHVCDESDSFNGGALEHVCHRSLIHTRWTLAWIHRRRLSCRSFIARSAEVAPRCNCRRFALLFSLHACSRVALRYFVRRTSALAHNGPLNSTLPPVGKLPVELHTARE